MFPFTWSKICMTSLLVYQTTSFHERVCLLLVVGWKKKLHAMREEEENHRLPYTNKESQ